MNTHDWPARPYLLALLGAASAFGVYLLTNNISPTAEYFNIRLAVAAAIITFSLSFGVIAKRDRLPACVFYALLMALVVGGIFYWRLFLEWQEPFGFIAACIAVFVLTPFFQSWLNRSSFAYSALHHHAWTNTLIGALGVLFVGLSFMLTYLLATLFSLIGIDFLKDLLREDVFTAVLFGTALGAAVGVLREHDSIIGSTQSVVQSIFSLLVTPLALGLAAFLLLLPFTGLNTLWSSTKHTSATLFMCAAFALLVVNAILRDSTESQSKNRIGMTAARVLALTIAPLAAVSGIALKLRVDQYGWTPDRMWATVICTVLAVYGVAYLVAALVRQFPVYTRSVNRVLAAAVWLLALLLATPLLDFGKISTQSQIDRLANGIVTEDKFDLTALAYDFGPSGREALVRLKENGSDKLTGRIDKVLKSRSRWASAREDEVSFDADALMQRLVVEPPARTVSEDLLDELSASKICLTDGYCYLFFSASGKEVLVLDRLCYDLQCSPNLHRYRLLDDGEWLSQYPGELIASLKARSESEEYLKRIDAAAIAGKIELKPVQRMQLFIDDEPLGQTIE